MCAREAEIEPITATGCSGFEVVGAHIHGVVLDLTRRGRNARLVDARAALVAQEVVSAVRSIERKVVDHQLIRCLIIDDRVHRQLPTGVEQEALVLRVWILCLKVGDFIQDEGRTATATTSESCSPQQSDALQELLCRARCPRTVAAPSWRCLCFPHVIAVPPICQRIYGPRRLGLLGDEHGAFRRPKKSDRGTAKRWGTDPSGG